MISCLLPDGASSPFAIHELARNVTAAAAVEHSARVEGTAPPVQLLPAEGINFPHVFVPPRHLVRWSHYTEDRFQRLIVRRGDGVITAEERANLDWLRSERQRLKNPLPAEQLLRDFQARELRNQAVAALQRYVDFIENPSGRPQT
jgi:hypothetical protein